MKYLILWGSELQSWLFFFLFHYIIFYAGEGWKETGDKYNLIVSLRISLEKDALMARAGWGVSPWELRTAQTKLRLRTGGTNATNKGCVRSCVLAHMSLCWSCSWEPTRNTWLLGSFSSMWKVDTFPPLGQLDKLADSQFNFILFLPFQAACARWGTAEGRPLLSKHNVIYSWGEMHEEQVHH